LNNHNSIDVWNVHLPDHRSEVACCRDLLSCDEHERAAKFFKPSDAERFIICRGLLRRILGDALNVDPASITFKHNGHGKPFLENTDLEFNVSHSRDRLLIAVAFGRAVGVDIEFRRSGIRMDAIAERWFALEERAFFQSLEKSKEAFFDIWAKKEAYVKALGQGVFKKFDTFAVPLGNEPDFPMVRIYDANGVKTEAWFFQPLEIDPAYAAALVSEAPPVPIILRTL